MPRLFVAIPLPDVIRRELQAIQPAPDPALRLTKPDQFHLTLHFLGETELQPIITALASIQVPSWTMRLASAGHFRSRDGAVIFWAGVELAPELLALHAAMGTALQTVGYQPERRPYSPHITLARGRPETPRSLVDEFVSRHQQWASPQFRVTEFALISSQLTPQGSRYHPENVFHLN